MTRRSVLLLCDDNPNHADTVLDHIRALRRLSRHDVRIFNPRGLQHVRALNLDEFDVVVLHYSLICFSDDYVPAELRDRISQYGGLKVQFLQDEYRWVDRICATIRMLGIDVLFSCLPRDEMRRLYEARLPGVRLEPTLTGYVPRRLVGLKVPDVAARTIDIGYRGRELPYWLGELAHQKVDIAIGVSERAAAYGLTTDIAWQESDRVYGRAWTDFLCRCRATLGTASGASIIDTDGSIEAEVRAYLTQHPDAGFDAVHASVLSKYEGRTHFEVVSPRIFEAAALRTALILFPGSYSGIVEPDRHYIPLDRDFSNFAQVARRLRDVESLRALTDRAYDDLIGSGLYADSSLLSVFDRIVDEAATRRRGSRSKAAYRVARIQALVTRDKGPLTPRVLARMRRTRVRGIVGALESTPVLGRLTTDPGVLGQKGLWALRLAMTDRTFRRVLNAWMTDRRVRARVSFDVLLEEALELIVAGKLTRQPAKRFSVGVQHDEASGVLRLVSANDAQHGAQQRFERALASGVATIEWDHRAFGGKLGAVSSPDREARDLHIGAGGLEKSTLLTVLAADRPHLVRALVEPLIVSPPLPHKKT